MVEWIQYNPNISEILKKKVHKKMNNPLNPNHSKKIHSWRALCYSLIFLKETIAIIERICCNYLVLLLYVKHNDTSPYRNFKQQEYNKKWKESHPIPSWNKPICGSITYSLFRSENRSFIIHSSYKVNPMY